MTIRSTPPQAVDSDRLSLMLSELRLPSIETEWRILAQRADKEDWPASKFLFSLAELELTERDNRRIDRHTRQAKLLPGKNLEGFDFSLIPSPPKARVQAFASEDSWIRKGANLLIFGPPGVGKSHLASAIGLSLVRQGLKVLFTGTSSLVQKMQVAQRNLNLDGLLARRHKFHLLILDDFACVNRDREESAVLFELISYRYEQRSILLTANLPFAQWNRIFPDQATAAAAVDRLVHHATIFEINTQSYRCRTALEQHRADGAAEPAHRVNLPATTDSSPATPTARESRSST